MDNTATSRDEPTGRTLRAAGVFRSGAAALLCALVLSFAGPQRPARAQDIPAALFGGAAGMVGGAYVSLGLVVTRARMGHYLHDPRDVFGWNALPIVIGAAAGATIGFVDSERLRHTIVAGGVGAIAGGGLGTLIGHLVWERPEGRWAGLAIGGGAGLAAGAIFGMLLPSDLNEGDGGRRAAVVLPVAIRIRL